MIHKICDRCGKTDSADFMVAIDDNIYCIECDKLNDEEEVRREEEILRRVYNSPEFKS